MDGSGSELGDIPKREEKICFGKEKLTSGCWSGIYKEVSRPHGMQAKDAGAFI